MARLWQSLSERFNGVPARVIFSEDSTLTAEGFRWAPRSLLGSAAPSWFKINSKVQRFKAARLGTGSSLGIATPKGLRVRFPGCRIEVQPLIAGLDLHPWRGIMKLPLEDRVYLKHKETGQWRSVYDWERGQASMELSADEMAEWYRKADDPICRGIDVGRAALIHDITTSTGGLTTHHDMHPSLLVTIIDTSTAGKPNHGGLCVRKNRLLLFDPISDAEALVVESLRMLAGRIATEDVTAKLGAIDDRESDEYKAALENVRDRMKAVMLEFWEATPSFASAVSEVFGPDMKEAFWVTLPKFCSHDVFITDLPADQVWLVD